METQQPSFSNDNEVMPTHHRMGSHQPEKETPLTDTQCAMLEVAIQGALSNGVSLADYPHLITWLKHQGVSDNLLAPRHREVILELALKHACRANPGLGRQAALESQPPTPPTPPDESLNDIDGGSADGCLDANSMRSHDGGSVELVTFDVSITGFVHSFIHSFALKPMSKAFVR